MTTLNPDLTKPTCRVCLQSSQDEMPSIFDVDVDFYDLRIFEKIDQCAGIKVLRHEKMPTLICSDCYGFLKVSYRFRVICRNSNEYLKEFVAIDIPNTKIGESVELNPLLISGNPPTNQDECSQYKGKLRDNQSPSHQTIENHQDTTCSSITKSKECVGDNINKSNNAVTRFNVNEKDISRNEIVDDNSIEKTNLCITTESVDKKTLKMSAGCAAIIRKKKPHTKRGKKEKHICDVCGNIYHRRYALELHVRRHRDEKLFKCEICGYAIHSNFELIRHMRKHTGSRPYKCSYCSRAFGDQSTLIKHERIHRNERPFTCDTCGKSFTYSNVLKDHKRTHTGEKPYSCELCGKCFTRPHHLRAHLETLQHLSDPRSKILLQNIRKNNQNLLSKLDNFALKI